MNATILLPLVAAILILFGGVAVVFALFLLPSKLGRAPDAYDEMQLESAAYAAAKVPKAAAPKLGVRAIVGHFGGRLVRGRDTSKLVGALQQADLAIKPEEWYAVRVATPLALAVVVFLARNSIITALLFAIVGVFIPPLVLRFRRGRRKRMLMLQLPDALLAMVNAVRSGLGLQQSLESCAETMPDPLGYELKRVVMEVRLGQGLREAIMHSSQRFDIAEWLIAVRGVRVQMRKGGSLASILGSAADVLRQRISLREDLSVETAQATASKYLLSGLPLALVAVLSFVSPSYMTPMFTNVLGLGVFALCGFSVGVAFYIIGRITDIEL